MQPTRTRRRRKCWLYMDPCPSHISVCVCVPIADEHALRGNLMHTWTRLLASKPGPAMIYNPHLLHTIMHQSLPQQQRPSTALDSCPSQTLGSHPAVSRPTPAHNATQIFHPIPSCPARALQRIVPEVNPSRRVVPGTGRRRGHLEDHLVWPVAASEAE